METLSAFDTRLFFLINHLPHAAVSDALALFFSGSETAGIIWVALGMWLFFRERPHHLFIVRMGAVLVVSWVLVETALKMLFSRLRPDSAMGAIVVGSGASWYSFPSSHATVAWASVVVLAHYEPAWKLWLWLLAGVISVSRVYLGVHYPSDVLAGGILGWCIGTLILYCIRTKATGKSRARSRT